MRLLLVTATAVHGASTGGLKYNAWLGVHGSDGAFLGNATDAATAGYRQFGGRSIAMAATLDGCDRRWAVV
jgi:hypothetical protein